MVKEITRKDGKGPGARKYKAIIRKAERMLKAPGTLFRRGNGKLDQKIKIGQAQGDEQEALDKYERRTS